MNFPLDLLSKIGRHVAQQSGTPRQNTRPNYSMEQDLAQQTDGEELDTMTSPVVRAKGSRVSFRNVIRRKESVSSLGAAVRVDEEVYGNVWDSSEIEVGDSPTPPDVEVLEEPPRGTVEFEGVEEEATGKSDTLHLDPPSTRVVGVLDPPLESSIPGKSFVANASYPKYG
jgi:hypothetical protein